MSNKIKLFYGFETLQKAFYDGVTNLIRKISPFLNIIVQSCQNLTDSEKSTFPREYIAVFPLTIKYDKK